MLVIGAAEVERLLTMPSIVEAVEAAHRELARNQAVVPVPLMMRVPDSDTQILAMAAASAPRDLAVVKVLADVPANRARGLPTQRSSIVAISPADGRMLAVIDGAAVTRLRTAAASAVATRHLARPESRRLGLIGAGGLASAHVEAIRCVLPIDQVRIWNRSSERSDRLAAQLREEGLDVVVSLQPRDVVEWADVVCTLTPSREPIVRGEWFRPGLHVNAVGAPPRADHREIDSEGMRRSRIVVDSVSTALAKSGDVIIPLQEGVIAEADIALELGHVVTGLRPGRTTVDEITLFNSLGLGLQDLATAALLLAAAGAEDVGVGVPLVR